LWKLVQYRNNLTNINLNVLQNNSVIFIFIYLTQIKENLYYKKIKYKGPATNSVGWVKELVKTMEANRQNPLGTNNSVVWIN